jgi:hypothetical protein
MVVCIVWGRSNQKTEDGSQKTEDRKRKSENRRQKTEVRKRKAESRVRNLAFCFFWWHAATLSGLSTLTGLAVVLTDLAELLTCQAPASVFGFLLSDFRFLPPQAPAFRLQFSVF